MRLVRLRGYKDVSDLHVADPDQFMVRWAEAVQSAEPWSAYAQRRAQATASSAWAHCAALATEPDILRKLDESLARRGVVGEHRAA